MKTKQFIVCDHIYVFGFFLDLWIDARQQYGQLSSGLSGYSSVIGGQEVFMTLSDVTGPNLLIFRDLCIFSTVHTT